MAEITLLLEKLVALGLTEKQARMYLAILRRGQATVLEISRDTGIERPTIYENAPHLEKLGLIETTIKGVKKYLTVTDPEKIHALVEEKRSIAKDLVEEIASLRKGQSVHTPIKLYSGHAGAKRLAQAILESKEKKIYTLGSYALLYTLFSEPDLRKLWKARVQRGVHVDTLFPASDILALQDNPDYSQSGNFRYDRDTRILPGSMEFHVMYTIVDDQVLFWSAQEENFFFQFSSPSYAASMKTLFSTLWDISKPLCKKPEENPSSIVSC
jgi:sugar-specific transcriptional regulator TrmB